MPEAHRKTVCCGIESTSQAHGRRIGRRLARDGPRVRCNPPKWPTFEFCSTRLVAAVCTQILPYMHHLGLTYGMIRTREAFVLLHIPADPTELLYYSCVPNQDVQANDDLLSQRTAMGQMLALTL